MASYKTNRTEEDILREMTAILRELKDPRIDPMLTVVRAELSRDLSDCKIFVSSLSGQETAKRSCQGLDSASGFIRQELFHRHAAGDKGTDRSLCRFYRAVSLAMCVISAAWIIELPLPKQDTLTSVTGKMK